MNAYNSENPQRKLVMWYKCKEKREKGLTKSQIAREEGIDVKTVRRYLRMSYEEFTKSQAYKRMYSRRLDSYEAVVVEWLTTHPDLSSSQVHDWLRERYDDMPTVTMKTVYNYVRHIRSKYGIGKPSPSTPRQYVRLEEPPYGEYAQADFGEMWMHRNDGRKLKVYFFVMVLCRSRKKYVWFSCNPFTSELAVYAHEKAFEYYGGKPRKIIYDQDAVLIHSENLGDYLLTKVFNAYVNQTHIECVFCRKSDPESKGKVENVVKYVKYNFLRGRTFTDITALNDEAIRWLLRTANGLPHNSTKEVPDESFLEERQHLVPCTGHPSMPENGMKEYKIHKNNTISYHGCEYSLPSGTYKRPSGFVWVNVCGNVLEIYDGETGKQLARHLVPEERGKYILDPSHRKLHPVSMSHKEAAIIDYGNGDPLAIRWLENMKQNKRRYYMDNLRTFLSEMPHFSPLILHRGFEISLDRGMYNARDFISLCDRIGTRITPRDAMLALRDNLPEAATATPDKTSITRYKECFV